MSGIVDGIFGGGDSGGTPSQVIDTTPDEFSRLRPRISNVLNTILGGLGGGVPQAPGGGANVAPITGQESNLLSLIGQRATQPGGGGPAGQHLTNVIGGQFLSPDSNPFLQQTIQAAQRPLIEAFNETTIPNLRAQFTAAGQMIQPGGSSPFDMAVARAQSGLMNALGDVSTTLAGSNFQAERARQQQAALQVSQTDMDNLIRGLQASALPRLIEQQGISSGLTQFNRQVDMLMQALALATGASTGGNVVLPGTAGQDTGSLLSGLGSLGVGIGALLPSDRRIKTDVKKIASTDQGFNVYSYRYKGHPFTHIGVMAQEVEKVKPDAVMEFGGMKFVIPSRL